MAISLNDVQSKTGISAKRVPPPSLTETFRSLTRPRCPDCGRRGMVCRYEVPASYTEPSPRYFECTDCASRYFRMTTGPWFPAAGVQFSHCYEMSGRAAS